VDIRDFNLCQDIKTRALDDMLDLLSDPAVKEDEEWQQLIDRISFSALFLETLEQFPNIETLINLLSAFERIVHRENNELRCKLLHCTVI